MLVGIKNVSKLIGISIIACYDAKGKGAYSYQALVQEVLNHA